LGKSSIEAVEARREQVWHLMLKGHNSQLIKRELNITHATVYRDIGFLQKKSKQYVYDMAK
jgi:DNA-binding CsgD family transcriptional regulator